MGDDILAARQPPKARSLEEANAQVAELDHVIRVRKLMGPVVHIFWSLKVLTLFHDAARQMLLQFLRQKGIVFPEVTIILLYVVSYS
jgi:hypothetical protein